MPDLNVVRDNNCKAAVVFGDYVDRRPDEEVGRRIGAVTIACGDRGVEFERRTSELDSTQDMIQHVLKPDAERLLGAICVDCPNRILTTGTKRFKIKHHGKGSYTKTTYTTF